MREGFIYYDNLAAGCNIGVIQPTPVAQLDTRSFEIAGVHLMKIRWTFIRIGKTWNVYRKIPTAQRMQSALIPTPRTPGEALTRSSS